MGASPCILSYKPHKLCRRNSFTFPQNTASLSNLDASGTLAGKFLTKACNTLMKPLEIAPETCLNAEFDNATLISFNILVKANNFLVLWGDIESAPRNHLKNFHASLNRSVAAKARIWARTAVTQKEKGIKKAKKALDGKVNQLYHPILL